MIGRVTGDNGCQFLATTTAHTGLKLYALVVNTDAVFTTLTATSLDGQSTSLNLLTANGFSGATVSQGTYISVPVGYQITAVTMSSGNAVGYKYVG